MTAPAVRTAEVTLCALDELPIGAGAAFGAMGVQVAVFRTRKGALYALSAVCTHAGGPIADGQSDERVVLCPLHLNAFELATGCSPNGQPKLQTYPVRLDEAGHVVVTVPC